MIVVLGGVAGSGKTTVGQAMAAALGWPFADGDSFHPPANVAKMAAGQPLTDGDRGPWLAAIVAWMDAEAAAGRQAIVACSALRRAYRDRLRSARADVRLVFLAVGHEAGVARLAARHGHFFPGQLLDSQFAVLEPPGPGEPVLVVDTTGGAAQTAAEVIRRLGLDPGR